MIVAVVLYGLAMFVAGAFFALGVQQGTGTRVKR